ncbi:MAG: hypothetical protein M3362_16850, partial [Acidobacteriota bacterium]|nr:hypothetical protein [Acidobacteriota bacterium]
TEGAVGELHRVLRKGGVAKVMLYHRNSLNYWVEIILRRGLLRGQLFRGQSPEQIMSRCVEYSGHNAEPLVKVYSRREARSLFKLFSEVEVEVDQMMREELRVFRHAIPESLFRALRRRVGWNVIITAKK